MDTFRKRKHGMLVVEDTSDPVPEISVEGVVVSEELILMTNQQVMFSALGTTDNLPLENSIFRVELGRWRDRVRNRIV